jgi:hypothetical protein
MQTEVVTEIGLLDSVLYGTWKLTGAAGAIRQDIGQFMFLGLRFGTKSLHQALDPQHVFRGQKQILVHERKCLKDNTFHC